MDKLKKIGNFGGYRSPVLDLFGKTPDEYLEFCNKINV